jgi:hypothetical protein
MKSAINILICVLVFLIILLFPVIFYFNKYELFTLPEIPVAYNARFNYSNKGVDNNLPWNHHIISSVYPHDIISSDKTKYYFEFTNSDYEAKLKKVLYDNNINNLIKYVEGIEWSEWVYPEKFTNKEYLLSEYNKVYDLILEKINASPELKLNDETDLYKIQIVHDIFKRYKLNKNKSDEYMFDIDILLYKESKLNGKHINILVIVDGVKIDFVFIKLVGVVHQDNIYLFPVISNESYIGSDESGLKFTPYVSRINYSKYLSHSQKDDSYYSLKDDNVNNTIESILYDNIINNYDEFKDDVSNQLHMNDDKLRMNNLNLLRDNNTKQLMLN